MNESCTSWASKLRHRVTLQERADTPDGAGGYARGWQDVADVWANIEPFSARDVNREMVMSVQLESQVMHRVMIRYRPGVTAAMRIQFGERIFNIRAVVNVDEANKMLEILAEEGVAV